jgi:type II restriction/modification system DNA methylase subunit YeeA
LDPACGSGNFLNLALLALKDIEHRANIEAELLGLTRQAPGVGPEAVLGIEINPYAAELARVSVWIGEIQWMRRNGFGVSDQPILQPLDNIECRDAILNTNGTEASWPEADAVIGNPPFLGDKFMRDGLGIAYTETLRSAYSGRVPGGADLACYWFEKARGQITTGVTRRAGLVSTNSIRGGANRVVLDRIVEKFSIFDAWADEEWTVDGAAVRVSLVCFGAKGDVPARSTLNGIAVNAIFSDLTAGRVDLTVAAQLTENSDVAFIGNQKGGAFDIPGELASSLSDLTVCTRHRLSLWN